MEKIDRRIRRTHKLLAEALVALAQRHGYDQVTIRDITEYADVSYSTFFRHYVDKDALLFEMIQSTVIELRDMIGDKQTSYLGGKVLFEHIEHHQALYRTLLGGFTSSAIVQRIEAIMIGEVLPAIPIDNDPLIPIEIKANHIATSVLALVKWWLDHDMPYSAARMGEIYAAMIMRPMLGK